jgi:hypothetical protein
MNSQEKRWYLSRGGKEHGPFSDADLANFSALGQLEGNDLAWREGFSEWRPAMTIFPKPEPVPAHVSRPNEPMRTRVDEPRRSETPPLTRVSLTWTKALIALTCSALIGAGSGYVFKHYLASTELTEGSSRQ